MATAWLGFAVVRIEQAHAQVNTATILGTVTDPTGARSRTRKSWRPMSDRLYAHHAIGRGRPLSDPAVPLATATNCKSRRQDSEHCALRDRTAVESERPN